MAFDSKKAFRDSVFGEILRSYVKAVHLFLYLIPVAVDIHLHLSSLTLPQFGQMLIVIFPDRDFLKSPVLCSNNETDIYYRPGLFCCLLGLFIQVICL